MEGWTNPKEHLAKANALCDVEFEDGKKCIAYRSAARGWFTSNGSPLSYRHAVKRYRYKDGEENAGAA